MLNLGALAEATEDRVGASAIFCVGAWGDLLRIELTAFGGEKLDAKV